MQLWFSEKITLITITSMIFFLLSSVQINGLCMQAKFQQEWTKQMKFTTRLFQNGLMRMVIRNSAKKSLKEQLTSNQLAMMNKCGLE